MRTAPHTQVASWLRLSACALWLTACATTATGRKQLTLMPSDQLDSMGDQAFQAMKQEQRVERESVVTDYVRCVARQVAQEVDEGAESWEVVVFQDPTANAFALPGGHIGVHTGLLDVARTPSQLATVLGHEIAHVTQDHANERMSQAFVAQGGLAAASIALDGENGPKHDLVMAALGLGAQYGVLMPFSRTQESEADLVGLHYMARAGFDPRAAVDLWQNMAEAGGSSPPEFLSTHPSHATRIEDLQEAMPEAIAIHEQAKRQGKTPDCRMPTGLPHSEVQFMLGKGPHRMGLAVSRTDQPQSRTMQVTNMTPDQGPLYAPGRDAPSAPTTRRGAAVPRRARGPAS